MAVPSLIARAAILGNGDFVSKNMQSLYDQAQKLLDTTPSAGEKTAALFILNSAPDKLQELAKRFARMVPNQLTFQDALLTPDSDINGVDDGVLGAAVLELITLLEADLS